MTTIGSCKNCRHLNVEGSTQTERHHMCKKRNWWIHPKTAVVCEHYEEKPNWFKVFSSIVKQLS